MYRSIYLIFTVFIIIGCSTKMMSPTNVAGNFWKAYTEDRLNDAAKFTLNQKINKPKLIKIESFDFGEVTKNKNKATIKTVATISGIDKHKDIKLSFDTKLIFTEEKGWKVDFDETQKLLYIEVAKNFTGDFKDILLSILKQGFSGFFDALDSALK